MSKNQNETKKEDMVNKYENGMVMYSMCSSGCTYVYRWTVYLKMLIHGCMFGINICIQIWEDGE